MQAAKLKAIFKYFPPVYSQISIMSEPWKVFNYLKCNIKEA